MIHRSTVIVQSREILLTNELKPPSEEVDPYEDQVEPEMVSYLRLNQLKESFNDYRNPKEKVHVLDNTLKEVQTLGIPTITFDMKELEKISRLTGNSIICKIKIVSRPYKKASPTLSYMKRKDKADEFTERILGPAKAEVENGMRSIESIMNMKRREEQLQSHEEMKILAIMEENRVQAEIERETKIQNLYRKDARNYIYAKKQHDIVKIRIKVEQKDGLCEIC